MAVLSAAEASEQAASVYVRGTYYIALTNSSTRYTSKTTYSTVQADEVTTGTGGYARLSYTYTNADLLPFSSGKPLSKKVATFVHDGSSSNIVFNHVVLLREVSGTYSVVGFQTLSGTFTLSAGNQVKINLNLTHGV